MNGLKMKHAKVILATLISSLMLMSCVNSGGSSSGGSSASKLSGFFSKSSDEQITVPDSPTSLGELPNGSQVIIAQRKFVEPQTGAFITSISLTSGFTDNESSGYKVSFSTTPINNPLDKKLKATYNASPLPSLMADDCVLTSNGNCNIILDSNTAPVGIYEITPTFTDVVTGKVTYGNSFTYDVRDDNDPDCHHDDGKLVVKLNSTNIAKIGETIYGTISLTDIKYDRNNEVKVEISPTNPVESDIALVTPQTCTVSAYEKCAIGIRGLKTGTTSFTVKAIDSKHEYKSVTTPKITVHAAVTYGYLNLKITPNSLNYNGEATAEVTLESAQNISDLTVNLASENPNIVQIENSCTIKGSTSGANTCQVKLKAESQLGYVSIIAFVPDSSYIPVGRVVSVHPTPTSGNLAITLQSPAIWYGQTTQAEVSLVDSSYVEPFTVGLTSSNTSIAHITGSNNCKLSSAQPNCKVTVTAQNEAGLTDIKAIAESYDPAQTTLEVYPTPIAGSLSIELTSPTVAINSDSVAIVKLNHSQNVKDAVVTVDSDNLEIAKPVGNNVCHLSTTNNTCEVTVHSNGNLGSTEIYTTATDYVATQVKLNVINPGTITMTPSTPNLEYGQSTQLTITLNNSIDVTHANVKLVSNNRDIATITNCNPEYLSTGSATCTATVIAGQTTGLVTIAAEVDSDGYIYPETTTAVNVTPNPLPGQLSVSVVSVPKNQQTTEVVTLNNSRLVNTPIEVSVTSQDSNIAIPTNKYCNLSSANPSCNIPVQGKNVGSTNMVANSSGYATAYGTVRVDPASAIPPQCSTQMNSSFTTLTPFNAVKSTYTFAPASYPHAPNGVPLYSNGIFNVATGAIYAGNKMYTDGSSTNPITIGSVTDAVTPNTVITASGTQHASCGGGWTISEGSITPLPALARLQKVRLHLFNNSSGMCGSEAPQHWEMDVPYGGNVHTRVYSVDQQGCGGGRWDMWGNVNVDSEGCQGDVCTYAITVNAGHGGDAWCNDSSTYKLAFTKPKVYAQLSNLGNFNQQTSSPTFIAREYNIFQLSLDGGAVAVNPVTTCQSNGWCNSTNPAGTWYTNNLSGYFYNATYGITLASVGATFGQICMEFNPS